MKITGRELAQMGRNGHTTHFSGTGLHRNWKKQPKGGKKAQARKAIREFA